MKIRKIIGISLGFILIVLISSPHLMAQCALCGQVAAAQNTKVAASFNVGILYLFAIPMSVMGFIGYRWYKINFSDVEEED